MQKVCDSGAKRMKMVGISWAKGVCHAKGAH